VWPLPSVAVCMFGSHWLLSTFWFFIAIAQTLNFACPTLIASATSDDIAVFPETTKSSPRPYITTSISVFGFTAETSLIQRMTACWSSGSELVRSNTTLYGFGCADCVQAAVATTINTARQMNESI